MKSIELFAGAGGLGMGVSLAGFDPVQVVEWDNDCCETLLDNGRHGVFPVNSMANNEGGRQVCKLC